MGNSIALVFLGVAAGSLSGLIGIGGGVIIVPSLIFIFGLSQHLAQGTTLALLIPPIGIFAAMAYYRQGYVDIRVALLVGFGFLLGGFLGARWAIGLSAGALQKVFGVALLMIGIKMIFGK